MASHSTTAYQRLAPPNDSSSGIAARSIIQSLVDKYMDEVSFRSHTAYQNLELTYHTLSLGQNHHHSSCVQDRHHGLEELRFLNDPNLDLSNISTGCLDRVSWQARKQKRSPQEIQNQLQQEKLQGKKRSEKVAN
jgi:hypothetical protein